MDTEKVSVDRVLFWDIPKAASTYVRKVVCFENSDVFTDQITIEDILECKEHICDTAGEKFTKKNIFHYLSTSNNGLGKKTKDVIIGVVRNPYDILVSYFRSSFFSSKSKGRLANAKGLNLNWETWYERGRLSDKDNSFKQFVKYLISDDVDESTWEHHLGKNPFFQMFDCSGDLVCDYILKVESLSDGVSRLNKKFGINFNKTTYKEKINFTEARLDKHYSVEYDEELKEFVQKKYSGLLDFFDYSFEDINKK